MDAARIENSTTVRAMRVPGWLRSGLKLAHRVAPGLAGGFARRLYFHPQRLAPRRAEAEVLARGVVSQVRVDGQAIAVRTWGRGPAVLLVHGWSGHMGQLTPVVDPLVAAGYRVVGFDWPGHGASAGGPSSLLHVGRVLAVLDAVNGGFHAVVAHSLGAVAATLGLARGELTAARAVFFAPASRLMPFFERFSSAFEMAPAQRARFLAATEAWLDAPLSRFEPLARPPTQPVLVLHSRDDRDVPFDDAEALVKAWPGAVLEPLEGLGHRRLLLDAQVLARAIAFVVDH